VSLLHVVAMLLGCQVYFSYINIVLCLATMKSGTTHSLVVTK